jgi:hypothetical protein
VLEAALDEIAAEAGRDEVAGFQVGLGAMVEDRAGRDVTGVHSIFPSDFAVPRTGQLGT